MILMQAPGPNLTFGAMPSGATYVSDQYSLIKITNDSAADQTALKNAGCFLLTPFGGWGNYGFANLADLYAADTGSIFPGITGYPQYTVCSVFSDPTSANDGLWYKTGAGNGSGNWTYTGVWPIGPTGPTGPQGNSGGSGGMITTTGQVLQTGKLYGMRTTTADKGPILPLLSSTSFGDFIQIFDADYNAAVNNWTLRASGADQIYYQTVGASTFTINQNGVFVTIMNDVDRWRATFYVS